MKTMLAAFAAILLIAIVADLALDEIGFESDERHTADSVRLD
ncbi:hypothetical protein [Jannaschia sp. S6380]|nr:hypothetical protein [Jannaschia sp. S6380]